MAKIVISALGMQRILLEAINVIEERTLRGIDAKGKPFKPYSKKPFSMPGAAVKPKTVLKTLPHAWFTTNRDSKWVVIIGGYDAYKRAARPASGGKVDLTFSGEMLGSMQIKSFTKNRGTIVLSDEGAKKALYNKQRGREFLGLTDQELQQISEKVLQEPSATIIEF